MTEPEATAAPHAAAPRAERVDGEPAGAPLSVRGVLEGHDPFIVNCRLPRFVESKLDPVPGIRAPMWSVAAIVSAVPFLANMIAWVDPDSRSALGAGSLAIGGVLTAAMMLVAPWAWQRVVHIGEPLDRMLGPEAPAYAARVSERLAIHPGRHYLWCSVGAVGGLAGAYLASLGLPDGTYSPAYYFGIGALGFLGVDAVRWLVRVPLILLHPLTRVSPLRVVLHSPANTPAIREMGQLAAHAALAAGIGLFLFGLPLLWTVQSAEPGDITILGERFANAEWLAILSIAPLLVTVLVVLYMAFVPQAWLSKILNDERDRILDELAAQLPEQGAANLLKEPAAKTMALYDKIAAAQVDTSQGREIFKRALAASVVLLPQLAAVVDEGLLSLL